MTMAQLEQRLLTLEQTVQRLQAQIDRAASGRRWWVEAAGRFADDPIFEEIVRLGHQYRESLRPKTRKGKRAHP